MISAQFQKRMPFMDQMISRSQFALNPTEDSLNNWKSPLSLVASKYAFGSRVMSSNDSLNMEHNQHSHDSCDQRVFGSVLASPAVSRRDFGPPQPAYAMPSQAPQPGKMLVDPQTGQHYFVPTAPQPHVAYYPVFYNAPPQSSQPVYYPHHPPAGYMMSAPPMPSPTVQNQPYYFPPTYNQQGSMGNFSQSFGHPPSSSQGYRVEVPPSSSVSICGERESPTQYFQRHHESRLSTESTNSSNSRHYVQNYIDGAKTDDSMSPVPQKSQHRNITPPTASSSNHPMDHSARYSTTSSSTTSGFVSQAGEGPSEHIRPNNLRTTFQKPQLYGSPSWWGEESSPEGNKQDERTPTRASNTRQNSRSDEKLQSPTTSTHSEVKASKKTESVPVPFSQETDPKPVMKSIRMDIDLSRPFSPEEKEKINVKATAAVQSTAFTVNFDDSNEKPKRPKPPVLSSQEQQKKQFRRSIPPSKPSLPAAAGNDTKHYLFSKMIQGFPKGEESATTAMMALSIKSETDTLSEAGTYVIENKDTKANRRQRKYSSSSSSSADSTETDGSSSRPTYSQPSSTRMYTPRTETATSSTVSSARSSDHQKPSQPFPMKRHLMKDLRDLRTQNQQHQQPPSPRTSLPAPKVRSMVDQSKNSRLNPPSPVKVCQQQQTTSRAGISNGSAGFRRNDGGRFSMRSGVQQPTLGGMRPATSQTMHQKPPFKAGVAPVKKASKDSPEMVAWLRRKEYDPRKSAAEAKKMQQLKQRSDNFFSNRSLSCNQPTAGGFRRLVRPFGDERSNKSHDDLSHVGEEPDDFSLSGSNSNLVRTVDELTQKCQRSMQLLKLCNPRALTPSVEHLLDEMVEEQGSVDGISAVDRLNRLSEAFGAIQKCLELQQNEKSGSQSPARDTVFTEALRQRLASPTHMDQSSSNSEAQSPDSFRPIAFSSN